MKEIVYNCVRAKRMTFWACACHECKKRQRAANAQPKRRPVLRCPHGVSLPYGCDKCGDPF